MELHEILKKHCVATMRAMTWSNLHVAECVEHRCTTAQIDANVEIAAADYDAQIVARYYTYALGNAPRCRITSKVGLRMNADNGNLEYVQAN